MRFGGSTIAEIDWTFHKYIRLSGFPKQTFVYPCNAAVAAIAVDDEEKRLRRVRPSGHHH
jgi:hypothetical protein